MSNNFIGSFVSYHVTEFVDAVREAFPEDGDAMLDEIVLRHHTDANWFSYNWEFTMSIETSAALQLIGIIAPLVTGLTGTLDGKKFDVSNGKLSLDTF